MAKLSKANLALLGTIVSAMLVEETPFALLTEAEIAGLAKEAMVETNAEIRDGDKIAVRATELGQATWAASLPAANPVESAPEGNNKSMNAFTTGSGFVPSQSRGGRGRSLYDFNSLEVGGYIFVPATEAKPTPAKSLASTVSSATKRSAPKKFGVQSVEAGKVYGDFTAPANGAVIYRTADSEPAAA